VGRVSVGEISEDKRERRDREGEGGAKKSTGWVIYVLRGTFHQLGNMERAIRIERRPRPFQRQGKDS